MQLARPNAVSNAGLAGNWWCELGNDCRVFHRVPHKRCCTSETLLLASPDLAGARASTKAGLCVSRYQNGTILIVISKLAALARNPFSVASVIEI